MAAISLLSTPLSFSQPALSDMKMPLWVQNTLMTGHSLIFIKS